MGDPPSELAAPHYDGLGIDLIRRFLVFKPNACRVGDRLRRTWNINRANRLDIGVIWNPDNSEFVVPSSQAKRDTQPLVCRDARLQPNRPRVPHTSSRL